MFHHGSMWLTLGRSPGGPADEPVDCVAALRLVHGDLSRFENPRQLIAYLGLTPSERSTGQRVKRGRDFGAFAQAKVISDDDKAHGIEIGRPNDVYRRVRMDLPFGKVTVLATDGHLPYPYGREITGYDVDDLSDTIAKAKTAGARVVTEPYSVAGRRAAMVQFPGGFIAEIHSDSDK